MKAKPGFNLREVCGEQIIVAEGEENIDFSNIISMNESAAFLWSNLQKKEAFTIDDMVSLLLNEYDVDEAVARKDAEKLAAQWGKAEIITGDDIPDIEVTFIQPHAAEKAADDEEKASQPTSKKGIFGKLFGK